MAHTVKVRLVGTADLTFSRFHGVEKKNKETADAYEKRTWRHKVHVDRENFIVIPGMAFKKSLESTAKYLSIQIPGKGKATYTKHFRAGFRPMENPRLLIHGKPVSFDDESALVGEELLVNSDGVSGSGKRVMRTFPIFHDWSTVVNFIVIDDTITEEVFLEHLTAAGHLQGIGTFRVGNAGMKGTFDIDHDSFEWEQL